MKFMSFLIKSILIIFIATNAFAKTDHRADPRKQELMSRLAGAEVNLYEDFSFELVGKLRDRDTKELTDETCSARISYDTSTTFITITTFAYGVETTWPTSLGRVGYSEITDTLLKSYNGEKVLAQRYQLDHFNFQGFVDYMTGEVYSFKSAYNLKVVFCMLQDRVYHNY